MQPTNLSLPYHSPLSPSTTRLTEIEEEARQKEAQHTAAIKAWEVRHKRELREQEAEWEAKFDAQLSQFEDQKIAWEKEKEEHQAAIELLHESIASNEPRPQDIVRMTELEGTVSRCWASRLTLVLLEADLILHFPVCCSTCH